MNKRVALLIAVVGLGSLTGCQLCLLPCYICAAGSGQTAAVQETKELPSAELSPNFVSASLTTQSSDLAH